MGRRQHYAGFYGLAPAPWADGRPKTIVVGNCQAESMRILLESSGWLTTMRIPPIFEWTEEDTARARALIEGIDVLVIQPVHADYRGMPCGTEQLEALLRPEAVSVRIPSLRYNGLHPYHAIVRDPQDSSLDPPVVPYSDLRTIIAAAAGRDPADAAAWLTGTPPLSPQAITAAAAESVAQLRRRQEIHGTVVMDDVLAAAPHWPTINHPDTATLMTLAQRTLDRAAAATGAEAGLTVVHPGRELLGGLEAPVLMDAATVLAAQLRPGARAEVWQSRDWDAPVSEAQVAAEQIVFCQRPGFLDAARTRCRERIEILGFDALLP